MARKLNVPVQVNRILIAQWTIALSAAGILLAVRQELALSALLGGLICVLPNMYFARQLFTRKHGVQMPGLVWSAFGAEFVKMALAILLFAIVFIHYEGVHPLALLITYFVAHACNWAVPLLMPEPVRHTCNHATHSLHRSTSSIT